MNKKNFKDFMQSSEGISSNILADRLNLLVENGIISKHKDKNNELLINYKITQKGLDLKPIFKEVLKWSKVYLPKSKTVDKM